MNINIVEALKRTTTSIKNWTDDKLGDKVDKVVGKSLSTNDYTAADKNKVANMPNDLMIIDGKLYLAQDGTPLSESAVSLPASGGGGGGSVSAAITLNNLLDSNIITTAIGQSATLRFTFTSSETESDGVAYIYINNVLKHTCSIVSGDNTIDIGEHVVEGTNNVKITCMDIYSNSKSLSYTINGINLRIMSTFDASHVYTGDINFTYTPYGAISKNIHFVLDGNDTIVVTSETSKQRTYTISALPHGVHSLKVYIDAVINGVTIRSNELIYDIMCVSDQTTTPLIASAYNVESITQGELINIPFFIYDPLSLTTDVTLSIKNGDEVYSSSLRKVDRTLQYWSTRSYPVGSAIKFVIAYGSISKTHTIEIKESSINIDVKSTNLEFELKAEGKSNEDVDRHIWENNGVDTTFTRINWENTGWIDDEHGDTALRLSGDAQAVINFMPFKTDARQGGRTLEMCFAIRDVNNRNAIAISCSSGGIGFSVTADTSKIRSEQTEVSCNYIDEEKVSVSFVIAPRNEYRMLSVYLNGVLSGVQQYPDNDNFQQQPPVNITIGSPYCCVDLYNIRSYNTALTASEVRDNYIASTTDIGEKLALYSDNDIYDDFGQLSFAKLQDGIPIMIITGELPKAKGDKKDVITTFTHPDYPSLNFEDKGKIDVQGTSSQWSN